MSTDEHLADTLANTAAAVLGFQLMFFGVAAKAFAITEGLLPEDESFDRWFKFEARTHPGYGPLPPVAMMRRTLAAMMCLDVGD